ncbi:MAG: AMP-binding protein [Clostridiales bacterium]|jgi:acetyl-CoA synthetase|nr:AMP-binding protein [Clostridiales bacterium]
MLNRFLERTEFSSYEDFVANYRISAPDSFNFGFDVVDAWAEAEPQRRALLWIDDGGGERDFTFSDMRALSNRAANFFSRIGVGKGDFVMLILKQRYEYWICAVALHKLGAVVIPATSQLTQKDIAYRNNAANVSAIVMLDDEGLMAAMRGALPESPTVRNLVVARGGPAERRESPAAGGAGAGTGANGADGAKAGGAGASIGSDGLGGAPSAGATGDMGACRVWDFHSEVQKSADAFERPSGSAASGLSDYFLMYFTSGTTGMPKMVMHDYSYPLGHITTAKYWQRVADGGLHMTVSDSGWAKFGWGKIYGQWLSGASIFAYDMDKFVPAKMLGVMQKYSIVTFCAPPTMYRFMIQEDVRSYDLSSIRHFSTAGEPLNPEVYNQWKALTGLGIIEGFGQSESPVLLANFEWFEPRPGSMGKPSPLYDIAVVDDSFSPCDEGIEGRLVVRGVDKFVPPGLFKFYYKDEALTKSAWREGCYNTGDIAWMDSDGYYWFVGRDDDIIKCSGYRIGPFEVESALLEHAAVVECAVTAAPDPLRGQIVKATIVLAKGFEPCDALARELQSHVKKVTAPYKYPRIVEFVDELPKTVGGKIKRGQIREESRQKQAGGQPTGG